MRKEKGEKRKRDRAKRWDRRRTPRHRPPRLLSSPGQTCDLQVRGERSDGWSRSARKMNGDGDGSWVVVMVAARLFFPLPVSPRH